MAPRTWCPAGISGLLPTCPCPFFPSPLPWLTAKHSSLCLLPTLSPWMGARSAWTTQASLPEAAEVVPLGPMGEVAATLEVVETRAMEVADMTVGLEDMDMDMDGPETTVAEARVVMTATQEEITETIMTTEMRHAHSVDTQGITLLIQDRPSKLLYL